MNPLCKRCVHNNRNTYCNRYRYRLSDPQLGQRCKLLRSVGRYNPSPVKRINVDDWRGIK